MEINNLQITLIHNHFVIVIIKEIISIKIKYFLYSSSFQGILRPLEVSFLLEEFCHDGNWVSGTDDHTGHHHDHLRSG